MPEYRSNTDEELILMFQNDDVEAFNEIVFRYKNKVVNFLYRYTGNREEAEDLAQDTFIKVFRSTAKTNAKKKSRMSTMSLSDYDPENEKDYELKDTGFTPEETANAGIENYYIQQAINSLEEDFKKIIILRDIEDLEYEEIVKITGLPMGTVKSRINRGREKLKKILSDIYPYNEK